MRCEVDNIKLVLDFRFHGYLVAHRIELSWPHGFSISNLIRFNSDKCVCVPSLLALIFSIKIEYLFEQETFKGSIFGLRKFFSC